MNFKNNLDSEHKKELVQKVNFCLSKTTLTKAREMAMHYQRSVSSLLRFLIDQAYSDEKGLK